MLEDDPERAMLFAGPAGLALLSAAIMASSGFVAWLFRGRPDRADRAGVILLTLGSILGLLAASASIAAPAPPGFDLAWSLPWGRFSVAIDGLSAAFLFPVSLMPALVGFYGLGYWPQRSHPGSASRVRIFLGLLAGAMSVIVIARDAILFLIAFEIITLSAYFLVTTEDEKREVRSAGWLYLAASHLSFILLLALFAGFQVVSGSFALDALAPGAAGGWVKSGLFALALVAFGLKAGVAPFHVWLPSAHAASPSHVSAFLSGIVIKIGVYGLIRVSAMLPDPPMVWGVSLLLLGALSGVGGVVFAIAQHDLKRLLAYHSIENIGIIVMGLGMGLIGRWAHEPILAVLGFGAAIFHVWNHALFKSLLFLAAGSAIRAAGDREIDRLGGLAQTAPWSAALFTLGAAAISGLPPLNGFVSEFILMVGALRSLSLDSAWLVAGAAPALALIGALACACFVKVVGVVFLGLPRRDQPAPAAGSDAGRECGWAMRSPMLILAALCVTLGLAPLIALPVLDAAVIVCVPGEPDPLPTLAFAAPLGAVSITGAAAAIAAGLLSLALFRAGRRRRTVATWNCGYLSAGPRTQYTGSSFGDALVGLFRFALRPSVTAPAIRGLFPSRAAYHGLVNDLVLDRWILPMIGRFAAFCERICRRRSTRTQASIVYVVAGMLGLLLLVVPVTEIVRRFLTR